VNHWAALSYGLVVTTWGAYPGHPLDDIKSGIGVVHNTMMFEKPQKTVVWGPFTMFPKPPWFVTHKNGHAVAQRITKFEYRPSFWKVPGIALKAMLG
jgi:aldehyde dehydrogenase (NAD(P)+)